MEQQRNEQWDVQTGKWTHRQMDKPTDGLRDRYINRQTLGQADRQRGK